VTQLGHGLGLDLSDALMTEVEELTHLVERAGLASVEPKAQTQDLALPLIEWAQQLRGLSNEQGGLNRRDDAGFGAERVLRVAVVARWCGTRGPGSAESATVFPG
jgi:hypothetical protein